MAPSRSMLEALLARVQKRAGEPRPMPAGMPSLESAYGDSAETLPPPRADVSEEDIEEYDEELIEIIDDADVIPQAAAAVRAIEPAAFGATLDRRPAPTPSAKPAARAAPADALRPESVSARPMAVADVARAQGTRRELRATSFLELLDASLKLGG